MKSVLFVLICCCLMSGCEEKRNSNIDCNSNQFNQLLSKYFSKYVIEDTLMYLTHDAYPVSWYFLKNDSLFDLGSRYCPSHWQANTVVLYEKSRLLWFQDEVETDSSLYAHALFLLCDTCGEILDSLCIIAFDGGATYDKVFDHEFSSKFYIDKKHLVWLYYKYYYFHDTMTCLKTTYDITETIITQRPNVQEYTFTIAEYENGWQGWK